MSGPVPYRQTFPLQKILTAGGFIANATPTTLVVNGTSGARGILLRFSGSASTNVISAVGGQPLDTVLSPTATNNCGFTPTTIIGGNLKCGGAGVVGWAWMYFGSANLTFPIPTPAMAISATIGTSDTLFDVTVDAWVIRDEIASTPVNNGFLP